MTGSGAELIRQMVAGDRDAFARFYDRYAPLVFPLIQRILRERADASDVLQEVFWEAWQGAAGYDPARGSPEAWLVTRARTRAIDRIRAMRRRSETFVARSEEHTSELQSQSNLVCRLLLGKKTNSPRRRVRTRRYLNRACQCIRL